MRELKPPTPTSLPSPENLDLNPFLADQTLAEFLGEGLGVRVLSPRPRWLDFESGSPEIQRSNSDILINSDCPSPPTPHPRNSVSV